MLMSVWTWITFVCVCVCVRLFLAVSIWLRCRSKRSHHVSDFGWSPRTLCHRQQVNWWVALFLFYLLFSIEGICLFAILLQFWRLKSLAVTINRSAKHKSSKKVKPLARTNLCGNKKICIGLTMTKSHLGFIVALRLPGNQHSIAMDRTPA